MILEHPLTAEQRSVSQMNYNRFAVVNGASYMCLGETVIILFAVRLGMPNELISCVGAMLYLGFVLLPLGVGRTAKFGAAQSQADFWVCRNIAALLVALSAVAAGRYPVLAWGMVLLGAFLFYGFRAAGVVMSQPLIGDITVDSDRAQLIGKSTALFYLSGMSAILVISILLKINSSLPVLCGIIAAGAVLGVTASGFIRGICETKSIRDSAREPVLPQLREILADGITRQQIIAGFVINLALIMTIPISVLTVKKGYGFSDTNAILFSLAQFASSIFASYFGGKLGAKYGPRLIVIWGYFALAAICPIWIFAPGGGIFMILCGVLAFVLQGGAWTIMQNSMIHYFLMSVPKSKQVAASMVVSVATGAGAGLAGMGLAALLLWLAGRTASVGGPLELYRIYFGFVLVLLLPGALSVYKLKTVIKTFRETYGEQAVEGTVRSGRRPEQQ